MTTESVFFNSFGRLRSGWRTAIFIAAFFVAGIVIGGPAVSLLYQIPEFSAPGSSATFIMTSLASLALAMPISWLSGRYMEGLPFRALGAWFSDGWLRNLLVGLGIGCATLTLACLVGMAFGDLSFRENAEASVPAIFRTLLVSFAVFAAAAAFEEVMFRGYIFQTFTRSGLIVFAVLLTAILFATVHNANPGATPLSWCNTFIAGVWLGVAYLKTRDLWLPFGLHLAWNWAQGSIFGIEVSGLTDVVRDPVLREIDNGPAWITGGDYGVEGGIACTAAIILSILLIYFIPGLNPSEEMRRFSSNEIPIKPGVLRTGTS